MIQRVTGAQLWADGVDRGSIGAGLAVFVGIAKGDGPADAGKLAAKVTELRIFPDAEGRMNRNIKEAGGEILVVSNFTLYANTAEGKRPSFDLAARPEDAEPLYNYFTGRVQLSGLRTVTGVFQAHMRVLVDNDGPVTLICESRLLT